MFLRTETLTEKKLLGNTLRASFAKNNTRTLWQGFMPMRKEIKNVIGTDLYSLEVYEPGFFASFNPEKEFDKWACVEVTDYNSIPDKMKMLVVPQGLYAVFLHKGSASEGVKTYRYIFETWLPGSGYTLANRPHFAVMGAKYKSEDPSSEEEIWIPVNAKQ
ncbi:MAG TPA: GyrI-like domain-containing protein [Bacteroidia bacterium]|jgi:AraC family transcriptional regulator|nr:GyrI-like domain-containing protein [Bacteroidia bacterium]